MKEHYPFGEAAEYKTFVAVADLTWRNCPIRRGDRVHLPKESFAGVPKGLEVDRAAHPISPVPMTYIPDRSPRTSTGRWKKRGEQ